VENIDKVEKEKVEEESKLALVEVQVVDDTEDVEDEPVKVPPSTSEASGDSSNKKGFEVARAKCACNSPKKRSWRRRRSLEIEEKNASWSK
jgi:hypothetical protein